MRRGSAARIWQRIQMAQQLGYPGNSPLVVIGESNDGPIFMRWTMEGTNCTVTLEHEGMTVEINCEPGGTASEGAGRAEQVALDIGRILKIANCVAACLLSTAIPPPGLVAEKQPIAGAAPAAKK